MKKFINALIIINGMIIPIFIGGVLYKSYSESNNQIDYESTGIIVGEKLDKAKADSLALQGLSYDKPFEVYNSTNFYMPLFAKTFEEARQVTSTSEAAGDIYYGMLNYVNVLFLDKDYAVIGTLLDKKASIIEITIPKSNYYYMDIPIDTTVKTIAYMIGFDDSNMDGVLDFSDNHDLYVSDLAGKNLTKVTQGKDVLDFDFIKSNSEIFIRYLDRSALRDEYKRTKFGLFRISTGEFKELKEIEKYVNEIEYSLIN